VVHSVGLFAVQILLENHGVVKEAGLLLHLTGAGDGSIAVAEGAEGAGVLTALVVSADHDVDGHGAGGIVGGPFAPR